MDRQHIWIFQWILLKQKQKQRPQRLYIQYVVNIDIHIQHVCTSVHMCNQEHTHLIYTSSIHVIMYG